MYSFTIRAVITPFLLVILALVSAPEVKADDGLDIDVDGDEILLDWSAIYESEASDYITNGSPEDAEDLYVANSSSNPVVKKLSTCRGAWCEVKGDRLFPGEGADSSVNAGSSGGLSESELVTARAQLVAQGSGVRRDPEGEVLYNDELVRVWTDCSTRVESVDVGGRPYEVRLVPVEFEVAWGDGKSDRGSCVAGEPTVAGHVYGYRFYGEGVSVELNTWWDVSYRVAGSASSWRAGSGRAVTVDTDGPLVVAQWVRELTDDAEEQREHGPAH